MRARMGGHWWSYENQRVNTDNYQIRKTKYNHAVVPVQFFIEPWIFNTT